MEKVFVYGTLKRGHGNHVLLEQSKFLGAGVTTEKYVMYKSGVPFVSKQLKLTTIFGELYSVDELTLNNLDMLEGHPNWYKREKISISYISDEGKTNTTEAWLYFNDDIPASAEVLPSGIYGYKRDNIFNNLLL